LIAVGRAEQLCQIEATMAITNTAMRHIFEKLGFEFGEAVDGDVITAELRL
jgi:RimJ/RimL family protein N-acetyltransferase